MKKLILSEVIVVALVFIIFLVAFTILNGWEKIDRERYIAVIHAIEATTVLVVIISIIFVKPLIPAAVTAVLAALSSSVGIFVASTLAITVGVFAIIAVVASYGFMIAARVVGITKEIREINIPKKIIWLSFGVETVVIIIFTTLIAFC